MHPPPMSCSATTPEVIKAAEHEADAHTSELTGREKPVGEVAVQCIDDQLRAVTDAQTHNEGQVMQCSSNAHSGPRISFGE